MAGQQGAQGFQGQQGAQGAQGDNATGFRGFQGAQGKIGTGLQGAKGTAGVQGHQGVQGAIGNQGNQGAAISVPSTNNILVGDGGGNVANSGYGFPLSSLGYNWITFPASAMPTFFHLNNRSGNTMVHEFDLPAWQADEFYFYINGTKIKTASSTDNIDVLCTNLGSFNVNLVVRNGIFLSPPMSVAVDTQEGNYLSATGGYNWSTDDADPSVGGCFVSDGANPQNLTFNINDLDATDQSAFLLSFVGNAGDRNSCDRIVLDNGTDHFEVGIYSVLNNGDGTILVNTWLHHNFILSGTYTISRRAKI